MVCSVYGNEHRTLKRRILALSFLDLVFITSTVTFVAIQLISVSFLYSDLKSQHNKTEPTTTTPLPNLEDNSLIEAHPLTQSNNQDANSVVPADNSVVDQKQDEGGQKDEVKTTDAECNSTSIECIPEDSTTAGDNYLTYKTVVGARISLSIQLIIYLTQFGFGILLFIATYHNDSRNLHAWCLFSEIMVVIICFNLFINFFGKFLWASVIVTACYIVFKIVLIRLVRRFIHVNDLALTQFGSVGEFD